jgi:hypothetical protein
MRIVERTISADDDSNGDGRCQKQTGLYGGPGTCLFQPMPAM